MTALRLLSLWIGYWTLVAGRRRRHVARTRARGLPPIGVRGESVVIGDETFVDGKPRHRVVHTSTKGVLARVVNCIGVVIGGVFIGSSVVAIGSVATICVIITKLYRTWKVGF